MKRYLLALAAIAALTLSSQAEIRYVFYFIGDGMGMGHVIATETYSRDVLHSAERTTMLQLPHSTFALTYSASSPITDSAAAGTALACGHKTTNGMVGTLPDTTSVVSIAHVLKQHGWGVGITTSVPIDDATPACFYAHQPYRKMFAEIGRDMAASGFDFFAGSHLRGDKDGKVSEALRRAGYTIAHGIDELHKPEATGKRVLLLANRDYLGQCGYTIDSIAGALRLQDITRAAIDHLTRVSPDRFFLMIEGGNIDWAAHSNDGAAVVKEMLNFNSCIGIALDFMRSHPDETLIVITADHDTGGMATGVKDGPKRKAELQLIDLQRMSKEMFNDSCKRIINDSIPYEWADMRRFLTEQFSLYDRINVTEKEDAVLQEAFAQVFKKHTGEQNVTLYRTYSRFDEVVFDLLSHKYGFGWTTFSHTANPVPVLAAGNGSEIFSQAVNNTEIPRKIATLCGVTLP